MAKLRIDIPEEAAGEILSEYLASRGCYVPAACGGRGTCGKCKVRVLSGAFENIRNGEVLACKAVCPEGGGSIEAESSGYINTEKTIHCGAENETDKYGIALDIGTTTLVAALVDIRSGEIIKQVSELNPQQSFGADVISRISKCTEGKLELLHEVLISGIKQLTDRLFESCEINPTHGCVSETMVVAGNTTMLHIFLKENPAQMGASPFIPVFTEQRSIVGSDLGLPIKTVTVLASASAFIGSDITAGLTALDFSESFDGPTLFVDIGTNGEIVLYTGRNTDRLLVTSVAAGPALEGAGIECGIGGVEGAVCAAKLRGSILKIKTVADGMPCGICGSGLIDIIAELKKAGVIDESGYMAQAQYNLPSGAEKSLYINQNDVRAFQLAKAAVRAGIETLAEYGGIKISEITRVFIAGGLGLYMNIENATEVGLIPRFPNAEVTAVGNTAVKGAAEALIRGEAFCKKVSEIAEKCKSVELSLTDSFSKKFTEYMYV